MSALYTAHATKSGSSCISHHPSGFFLDDFSDSFDMSGHVVFLPKILKMMATGIFILSGCHDRMPHVEGLLAAESSGGWMCTIKAPAASASGEGLDSRSVHGRPLCVS